LVSDLNHLDEYAYSGHAAVLGKRSNDWQNIEEILLYFSKERGRAKIRYRKFLEKAANGGKRSELTGGGLVRSSGGWREVNAMRRSGILMKGDERILGTSDFVATVLRQNKEIYDRRAGLKAKGVDINTIAQRVSEILNLPVEQIWSKGKYRHIVRARSLLCFWAVHELGMQASSLARIFEMSPPAISKSVLRGEMMVKEKGYSLGHF